MKIAVTCPQCGAQHQADPALAGTKARCRCGALLKVPGETSVSTMLVVVQCPSCSRRYAARASLAGSQTRCACGATLTIAPTAAASASALGLPAALPIEEDGDEEVAAVTPMEALAAAEMLASSGNPLLDPLLLAEASEVPESSLVLVSRARQRRTRLLLTWFCLVVGVAAVAALVAATVISALDLGTPPLPLDGRPVAGGPLGGYSWCIPPRAHGLAAINVQQIRQNAPGLFGSLLAVADLVHQPHGPTAQLSGSSFCQKLSEIAVAWTSEDRPIVVVQSQEELSLEELVKLLSLPSASRSLAHLDPAREYRGVMYQKLQGRDVLVAQIAPNAFCVTERDKDLRAALKRWEQGHVVRLESPLRTAWDGTSGDARFAMAALEAAAGGSLWEIPKLPGVAGTGTRFPRPGWAGLDLSCEASMVLHMTVGFFTENEATAGEKAVREAVEPLGFQATQLESRLQRLPPNVPRPVEAAQDLGRRLPPFFTAVQLRRAGAQLQLRGEWAKQDVEPLVQELVVIREALCDAPP